MFVSLGLSPDYPADSLTLVYNRGKLLSLVGMVRSIGDTKRACKGKQSQNAARLPYM